ncbi:cation:proton antiporter domain-containing protein [Yoonia litorea]|uniref:Kef-type potassium/proton antiporter, CPA2 family n=1 Tax=Yoonia litorea TaxID=1123755 RepID=A0A1I6MA69_9RHOB|nr:cation:proton antiporter [Yoonia litorea]SFS12513.1 Kef-type potassium/proton antiporter, CPA2 family [Yoonia litorea]
MTDFLLLAFIFLVAGVVAVPIASRYNLGSVLGYLIAGIAISPILAVLDVDVISIQHFAEFGVVMMLFLVGLELEPRRLWEMRGELLGLGGGQVALTAAGAVALGVVFGLDWRISLAIGLIASLSSTAIVLQSLNEKGLMRSDGGRAGFSVLLAQDIAVIAMLALMPLLAMPELLSGTGDAHAQAGDAEHHDAGMSLVAGLSGWQTALVNVVAIAAVIGAGSYLTRPIFRFIAAANLRELFTATALMIVIGIALLMSLVGLSPALGTFLAGVVLANSEYRHELESDVDPFKGLLLGLFFMTVGAAINFGLFLDNVAIVIGLTVLLIALKAGVLLLLAVVFRIRGADRWLLALSLAQASEFGFVLLSFSVSNAILPQELADLLLLVVAFSMMLTPILFILYDRAIVPRYTTAADDAADDIDEPGEVIIAGGGRVGGLVRRILSAAGYSLTVIDYNAQHLENMRRFGARLYYGDATRPDMLHAAGLQRAKMIIVAIDDRERITSLVKYVIANAPQVHVIARAVDRHHVYELWAAGCRDIIRESYDSSLRMGRSALEALDVPKERAQMMVEAFNRVDRASMISLASAYDPNIPVMENEPYIKRVQEVLGPREAQLHAQMMHILETGEMPAEDAFSDAASTEGDQRGISRSLAASENPEN